MVTNVASRIERDVVTRALARYMRGVVVVSERLEERRCDMRVSRGVLGGEGAGGSEDVEEEDEESDIVVEIIEYQFRWPHSSKP